MRPLGSSPALYWRPPRSMYSTSIAPALHMDGESYSKLQSRSGSRTREPSTAQPLAFFTAARALAVLSVRVRGVARQGRLGVLGEGLQKPSRQFQPHHHYKPAASCSSWLLSPYPKWRSRGGPFCWGRWRARRTW